MKALKKPIMLELQNSYQDYLNEDFYELRAPDTFPEPQLLAFNDELAQALNLNLSQQSESELAQLFSGQALPKSIKPMAMAYAGHQFGNFVPQLGDGRAVLLGDIEAKDGLRYDLQLKGSGATRFSRNGDGKSALGPVIREYLVSEAMYHLGIPTTRALAAVRTGEMVYRQRPEPGGIFTRVARGHVRIGTFEYFASRQMLPQIKQLADYSIQRFYPETKGEANPYLSFFDSVGQRLMALVAQWMGVGFIHGVMNTDNMSIAGETIDYGPCAFMDVYDDAKVFSSIDRHGRYAYNQQAKIAQWNLSILASCLVPLIDDDEKHAIELLQEVMNRLPDYFEQEWLRVFRPKLGLFTAEADDKKLILSVLEGFKAQGLDFTVAFHGLKNAIGPELASRHGQQPQSEQEVNALMSQHNPYLIPRNHWVEDAIEQAYEGDMRLFEQLKVIYKTPYAADADLIAFHQPPSPEQEVRQTFCGT